MRAIGALSPWRGPSLRMRVSPPARSVYRGPISANSLCAMSLSRINATTWRCKNTLRSSSAVAFLALVMHFSTTGRRALALASVVTMASAAMREATRLPIMAFWCSASPPKRRPFRGRPGIELMAGSTFLSAQRQAPLVQLLQDFVEGLLAEVGDRQQVVLGLLHQFADRVDLSPLEAVAGPLGQIQVLDWRG